MGRGIQDASTGPNKKSRRSDNPIRKDYISSLPDGVMGEILSKVPLKEAVRTSVLSKDWRSKWTLIYNISIDADKIFPRSYKNALVELVDKILFHIRPIRSFHLTCSFCGDPAFNRVLTWVSAVLEHELESLLISVRCDCKSSMSNHQLSILPSNCLICDSLKNLVLKMPCDSKLAVEVAVSDCFANLTRLCLESIKIINKQSDTGTLVFTFPVLKQFKVAMCELLRVILVEIHAPLLTRFSCISRGGDSENYSFKVIGASLEKLSLGGCDTVHTFLVDSTVSIAHLSCWYDYLSEVEKPVRILKLLKEVSNVNTLKISGYLEGILRGEQGRPFIRFPNLRKLHMTLPNSTEVLLELLHAAPFLKSLELLLWADGGYVYDYETVESVPSCLVWQLEKLILDYTECEEEPEDFSLVEFLLENGLQLKNVCVRGSSALPADEIIEELSTFSHASFLNIQPII